MFKFLKKMIFGADSSDCAPLSPFAHHPMQKPIKVLTNGEKWELIKGLHLTEITENLKRRKKWTKDLTNLELDYRRFLYLVVTNPTKAIVPWSQDLDDYWHEHILDTRKYFKDCLAIHGKTIHHDPHLPKGTAKHSEAASFTKNAYKSSFSNRTSREQYWVSSEETVDVANSLTDLALIAADMIDSQRNESFYLNNDSSNHSHSNCHHNSHHNSTSDHVSPSTSDHSSSHSSDSGSSHSSSDSGSSHSSSCSSSSCSSSSCSSCGGGGD